MPGSKPAASGPPPIGGVPTTFKFLDIDDRHRLAVAADREQLLVLDVDGEAGGSLAAGRERDAPRDRGLGGVDLDDFARAFQVDVQLAGAIRRAEFAGFGPSGNVLTTSSVLASMAVASLPL